MKGLHTLCSKYVRVAVQSALELPPLHPAPLSTAAAARSVPPTADREIIRLALEPLSMGPPDESGERNPGLLQAVSRSEIDCQSGKRGCLMNYLPTCTHEDIPS